MPIPFLDLSSANEPVKSAILTDLAGLLDSGEFTLGPQVDDFEAAFAEYVGASHCVGMSSGLDALRIALLATGVPPGSEVVVPANTFIATFEAITQAGAVPVPVDVTESDYNIDVAGAEAAITDRTSALLPVHLYGQMADMARLLPLARAAKLTLVEDACQAHGSSRGGIGAGTAGGAAAFSFYPAKNLGAFGDAGALVTGSLEVAEAARMLRTHGQSSKNFHVKVGYTARLDTIQAVVLLRKLPFVSEANVQRVAAAAAYSEGLCEVGDIATPNVPPGSLPAWHVYVIRTSRRDALARALSEAGIGTGVHYPTPPHLTPAYRDLGYGPGAFPVSERLSREVLSLPLFPGIAEGQIEAVVDAIRRFFDG